MKIAVKQNGTASLQDIDLPRPGPDQLRIRVEACGVCGTDLHLPATPETKATGFGHEFAGTILELGSEVHGFEAGQRVAVESATACGRCDNCRNTRQELCTDIKSFFSTPYFGFAEETLIPAASALPVGEMSAEAAALSEPLGVAVDMVRIADLSPANNVLVTGPGCIGLMAVALAKAAGVRRLFVAGTKRRPVRLHLARQFGADDVIDVGETALAGFDYGCTIDRVLVTAPPKTLPDAFAVAAKGAIVSFIGIEHGDGAFCTFDANAFHFKKLQLRASFASPALYTPKALQCIREGVVDTDALISHRYPLDQIQTALDTARDDAAAIKVVVTPGV